MSQERRFRGGLDGHERPFEWRALARRCGIPERDARELYEETVRQASVHREPRRYQESIYLELLEGARQQAWRPSPGKVTRTMRLQAERASKQRRSSISPLTGQPIAPGKRTLTSYIDLAHEPAHGRRNETHFSEELTGLVGTALRAFAPDPTAAFGESRADTALRLYAASLAVAMGDADALDARDRELLADDYVVDGGALRPDEAAEDIAAQPLPEATRTSMEHAFGQRFDDVRVHPYSPKATGRAYAVTEGRDIHFARGRYAPGTARGDWLIGHELAHVVQQTGSVAGPRAPGYALEAEANASAAAIMGGRRPVVQMRAVMGAAQAYEGEDEVKIHGKPVRKPGIVSVRDGVKLRDRPLPGRGSNVLRKLPFNTSLFVDTETSDGWYHVTLSTGEFGYVAKTHVKVAPEPTAKLHEVASGETAIGIAEKYYKSHVEWGEDLRFYVNVLAFVNGGSGKRGIYKQNPNDSWKETKAREGYLIWIPGVDFAKSLKGRVKSGSISHEAWDAVKNAAKKVGEFVVGGAALVAGLLHGALESLWDIVGGLKDLGVMAWNVLKSVVTGSVLSDAKALYEQIAALDLGKLVVGWIDDFKKKWNDPSIMKRWHFRGWVIGYAIMEIVLLVVSFGAATGAKWAGKAAKLVKAITSLPRVQQTIKAVKSIKVPPKLKEGLSKVFKGGATVGDINKIRQKLLSKLSPEAQLAVKALPDDEIAKIARLHDKSPDAVDDILRGYYHKVVKKGGDISDAARYVDDSLKAMKVTQGRGFPYGFADLQKFESFKGKIEAALRRYGIPYDDVAVHGSSVIRKTPNDIDVAVLVDKSKFDEIVRGIQAGTDKSSILKQLRTEAAKGKIPSFLFERKVPSSSFGSEIYGSAGKMKVQVSLIEKSGPFDIGPYIKF